MKVLVLTAVILTSLVYAVQAQRTLILKKLNSHRSYQYAEGETIELKLKNKDGVIKGKWQYENDDSILVEGEVIDIQNIKQVNVKDKEKGIYVLRKGQDLLILLGLGYLTLTQIERLSETGQLHVNDNVLRTSTVFVAGGLICTLTDRVLRKRKIIIGRNMFSLYMI